LNKVTLDKIPKQKQPQSPLVIMPMGINAYDYDFLHFSRIIIWQNGNKYLPLPAE
jgi:hypothetical protein